MPIFAVDVEVTMSARYFVDAEDEESANQRAEEEAEGDYPEADSTSIVDCDEAYSVPQGVDVLEA